MSLNEILTLVTIPKKSGHLIDFCSPSQYIQVLADELLHSWPLNFNSNELPCADETCLVDLCQRCRSNRLLTDLRKYRTKLTAELFLDLFNCY